VAKLGGMTLLYRHGRACPGHPRVSASRKKTWMRGSSPRMTIVRGLGCGGDSPAVQRKFPRTALRFRENDDEGNTEFDPIESRARQKPLACRANSIASPQLPGSIRIGPAEAEGSCRPEATGIME